MTFTNMDEPPALSAWARHGKHVIVLTAAGKPVWSRHGDRRGDADGSGGGGLDLPTLTSVIQAVISRSMDMHDPISTMRAGGMLLVFNTRGPLHLVAASRAGDTEHALAQTLRAVHNHLLFAFSAMLHQRLIDRPSADIRPLLSGCDVPLRTLIRAGNRSPCLWLDAFPMVSMGSGLRGRVAAILSSASTPVANAGSSGASDAAVASAAASAAAASVVYVILTAGYHLVAFAQTKGNREHWLRPSDLAQLTAFLCCSQTLRSGGDVATPLCLPGLSQSAFVHAYIGLLGSGSSYPAVPAPSATAPNTATAAPPPSTAAVPGLSVSSTAAPSSTLVPASASASAPSSPVPSVPASLSTTMEDNATTTVTSVQSATSSALVEAAAVAASSSLPQPPAPAGPPQDRRLGRKAWMTAADAALGAVPPTTTSTVASSSSPVRQLPSGAGDGKQVVTPSQVDQSQFAASSSPAAASLPPPPAVSTSLASASPIIPASRAVSRISVASPLHLTSPQGHSSHPTSAVSSSSEPASSAAPADTAAAPSPALGAVVAPVVLLQGDDDTPATLTTPATNGGEGGGYDGAGYTPMPLAAASDDAPAAAQDPAAHHDVADAAGGAAEDNVEFDGDDDDDNNDVDDENTLRGGFAATDAQSASVSGGDVQQASAPAPSTPLRRRSATSAASASSSSASLPLTSEVAAAPSTPSQPSGHPSSSSATEQAGLLSPWQPPPPYHPDRDHTPPVFLTIVTTGAGSGTNSERYLDALAARRATIARQLGDCGALLSIIRSLSSPSLAAPQQHQPGTAAGGPFPPSDINIASYHIQGLQHMIYIQKPLRQYAIAPWPACLASQYHPAAVADGDAPPAGPQSASPSQAPPPAKAVHRARKALLRAYQRIYERLTMPTPVLRHVVASYSGGMLAEHAAGAATVNGSATTDTGRSGGGGGLRGSPIIVTTLAGIHTTNSIIIAAFDQTANVDGLCPAMEQLSKQLRRDNDRLFMMLPGWL